MERIAFLLPAHVDAECAWAPVPCDLCSQEVLRGRLLEHIDEVCPLAIVSCPYAQFGCDAEKVTRPAMRQHLLEYAIEHTDMMKASLKTEGETKADITSDELGRLQRQVRELTEAFAALSELKPHLPHAPLNNSPCLLPSSIRVVKSNLVKVVPRPTTTLVEYSQPFIRIFSRTATQPSEAELVVSDHSIPIVDGLFFFELRVLHSGISGAIGIGITTMSDEMRTRNDNTMPGWRAGAYGYHGDDGKRYGPGCEQRGANYGPVFGVGDVVGCGYAPRRGVLFFTKNTMLIGFAFTAIPTAQYFPAVGLHSGGAKVEVNFGAVPFVFNDLQGVEALEAQPPASPPPQ